MISNKTSQIENIGIDIVDIERFRKRNFSKNERFYEKIFTSLEIDYCRKFHDPYPHFAGKFAAKEAIKKTLDEPINFLEIHTRHGENGEPNIECPISEKFEIQVFMTGTKKDLFSFLSTNTNFYNIST